MVGVGYIWLVVYQSGLGWVGVVRLGLLGWVGCVPVGVEAGPNTGGGKL